MHQKYERYKQTDFKDGVCTLCQRTKTKPVKQFRHWKIIDNWFPWDRISKTHHMIIPKRHASYKKLNRQEKQELDKIKLGYVNETYGIMAEATHRIKSIPDHYHLHLIILK